MTPRAHPHLSAYRRDGEWWLVDIRLRDVRQLFETLDPAPFRERDLDPVAETYLEDAVRDIGASRPIRLRVHLPAQDLESGLGRSLPEGREVLSGLRAGEKVAIPSTTPGREGCS